MSRLANLLHLRERMTPPVGSTPADVVLQENKWRLLRYRPASHTTTIHRHPLLLVPSVVNRWYVLDLLPHKSVAASLAAQGFDTFCIDWGTPEPEDRFVTFDDVVERWLGRALRTAARLSQAPSAHLLGYCLGGTFAAIHTALHPGRVRSLTLLAAPIEFSDQGMLRTWTSTPSFDVRAFVDAFGIVPGGLMQLSFQMLRPTTKAARFVGLLDRFEDREFLDAFFALEKWGGDTPSLPGEFYVTLIERLYQGNALMRGDLSVAGQTVDLAQITAPLCALTFVHDSIAPPESCQPIIEKVSSPHKLHLHQAGSHVGGAVSSRALSTVWPKVAQFLIDHDNIDPAD